MKKLAALLLSLLMMSAALAEIEWSNTAGQQHLAAYVSAVNATLAELDEGVIDVSYELYSSFACLGMDGVTMPDDFTMDFTLPVEMQFVFSDEGLYSLTLRVSELERFTSIAAACLHAASPEGIPLDTAQTVSRSYASAAISDWNAYLAAKQSGDGNAMTNSFEEEVVDLQGSQPRAYFAYYPDQYGDEVAWLQMTLIFARPGSAGGSLFIGATPPPETSTEEYEGYFSQDNYDHFETFASPTPEPDSAAMENW